MADGKTLYDVLEVARTASPEVIDASYQSLREKRDPEIPGNAKDDNAKLRFNALREAFVTLSNPDRRKRYDARLEVLENVEIIEPFWTPARVLILILAFTLGGAEYWKYRSDLANAEMARIAADAEKARLVEIEKKRADDERAAAAAETQRQAMERRQQSELESARRYADQLGRQNDAARLVYERQLQIDQQRQDQEQQRQRQQAELEARRQAMQDQQKPQQLQYQRLYGR